MEHPGPCETPRRDFNQSGPQTRGKNRSFERKPSGKSANGAMEWGSEVGKLCLAMGLDPEALASSGRRASQVTL